MTPLAVPRSWPGAAAVLLAGGPSLASSDVEAVRASGARILAIKDAIRLAPDADALYACDAKWWQHYGPGLAYAGPRYALESGPGWSRPGSPWGAVRLRDTGPVGLEADPSGLRTGRNSGYQAINLAVHLGASRIVLLGYDMRHDAKGRHHWFGEHPYGTTAPPYAQFLPCFETLVAPLRAVGVEVLNATPGSALTVFPLVRLADALRAVAA